MSDRDKKFELAHRACLRVRELSGCGDIWQSTIPKGAVGFSFCNSDLVNIPVTDATTVEELAEAAHVLYIEWLIAGEAK